MAKDMVPVLPEWCDYHSYTFKQRTIFLGICRAIISLISLALCIVLISKLSEEDESEFNPNATRIILILICIINAIHFVNSTFLICIGQSKSLTDKLKLWVILDLIICTVYVLLIILLLLMVPQRWLYIILGMKLMMLSILLGYRSGVIYRNYEYNKPYLL